MIEDHNRNYASMQKQANEKRKAIKDFDKRQDDKKMKEFDSEVVKKIEMLLANKKSADYVKGLSSSTVPKQRYLYQRFAEEGAMR